MLTEPAIAVRLRVCHRCREKRNGLPSCTGACPCPKDGAPIITHAVSGECPINRFPKFADVEADKPGLVHGATGVMKAVMGIDKASDEEIARRHAICGGCEHARMHLGLVQTCRRCGCVVKLKVRVKGEVCPAGKW